MPSEKHKPRSRRSGSPRLTPVEFQIMEIVWELGSALVKDVHRELYRRKGLAYTTVMTEMTQMYRKGVLSHSRRGRAFLYSPRLSRREALEGNLQDFISDFFHGSTEEFSLFVGGDREGQQKPSRAAKPGETALSLPSPPPARPAERKGVRRPVHEEEDDDVTLL